MLIIVGTVGGANGLVVFLASGKSMHKMFIGIFVR